MQDFDRVVVVMAKQPMAGFSKTRLSPPLAPLDVVSVAAAFLTDSLQIAAAVPEATPAVGVFPSTATEFFEYLFPGVLQVPQVGSDLAQRLAHVMTATLNNLGFKWVVAINSDSPTMPATYIQDAFELLESGSADVVLGPADDGGYYLIGWGDPQPEIIRNVTMSTATVLEDTLVQAARLDLRTALTPACYDVDTPADLDRLCVELAGDLSVPAPATRKVLTKLGLLG